MKHPAPTAGLAAARAVARCGARTRAGCPCAAPAMANGRCRMHGGPSTGPRTPEGRARCSGARLQHGGRTLEAREAARLRGEARRFNAGMRALLRDLVRDPDMDADAAMDRLAKLEARAAAAGVAR